MIKPTLLALVAALAINTAPASADELAREANVNLALAIGDTITTRIALSHGLTEGNPTAQPFAKTTAGSIVFAVGTNLLIRMICRQSPKSIRYYDAFEISAILLNISTNANRKR